MTNQIYPYDFVSERWFVYDPDDWGYETFDSEKAAEERFNAIIEEYRKQADGDEWSDGVERVEWGKVNQSVTLSPIDDPRDAESRGMDPDAEFADAFLIEHRCEFSDKQHELIGAGVLLATFSLAHPEIVKLFEDTKERNEWHIAYVTLLQNSELWLETVELLQKKAGV